MENNSIRHKVFELVEEFKTRFGFDPLYVCMSTDNRAKLCNSKPKTHRITIPMITVSARCHYTNQIRVEGIRHTGELLTVDGYWEDEKEKKALALEKAKATFQQCRNVFKKRTSKKAKPVYYAKTMEQFEMLKASYYADLCQIMFEGDE